MLTRRSAASLLGSLPLIGGALAKQGIVSTPPNYPPPNATLTGAGYGQMASQYPSANEPLMPQWRAASLALRDPDILALARSIAFEGHRRITSIDPDIEVYRSFSPMAKITFQRQRNVERDIAGLTMEPSHERGGIFRKMVDKLMWGRS